MRNRKSCALLRSLSFAALVAPGLTLAEEPADSPWQVSLGLGALHQPTYAGSPNRRTTAVPLGGVRYRHERFGEFAFDHRGLSWTAFRHDRWQFGAVLAADGGRKDTDPSGPVELGDARLAGMGEVEASAELGVFASYGPLSLQVQRGIGSDGHQGVRAALAVDHSIMLSQRAGLSLGASLNWADEQYLQSYFGVTALQAAATDFRMFTPKAGLQSVDLSLGLEYPLSPRWSVQSALVWTQLLDEAADSPLVEREQDASVVLGLVYRFR